MSSIFIKTDENEKEDEDDEDGVPNCKTDARLPKVSTKYRISSNEFKTVLIFTQAFHTCVGPCQGSETPAKKDKFCQDFWQDLSKNQNKSIHQDALMSEALIIQVKKM